jgi:hypothetical protein
MGWLAGGGHPDGADGADGADGPMGMTGCQVPVVGVAAASGSPTPAAAPRVQSPNTSALTGDLVVGNVHVLVAFVAVLVLGTLARRRRSR